MKDIFTYIWLDGEGNTRSKCRVLNIDFTKSINKLVKLTDIPLWNYDGSSTGQATVENSEIILKPVRLFTPKKDGFNVYLVLCDIYDINDCPIKTNTRFKANEIFQYNSDQEAWFGLEQEYYIIPSNYSEFKPSIFTNDTYCSTNIASIDRTIVTEHLNLCLTYGLTISGINAEVTRHQWEYQIGPCLNINAGDEMIIARYLLETVAEKYDYVVSFKPKFQSNISGSGCHINFSTKNSRAEGGYNYIEEYIQNLSKKHTKLMKFYGKDNEQRLTGIFETAKYDEFTFGVGTRNTSIRIPFQTKKDNCGYLEDRRPGANIDPYLATSNLLRYALNNDEIFL